MKLYLSENVMVDLETLGNGSNAMIVAIGACDFELNNKFYAAIDPEKSSGDIDASTVKWWMSQSESARTVFKSGDPLEEILKKFSVFLNQRGGGVCVWGNGATFDNVILANAYKRHKLPLPWKFWNDRCYRTLKNLHPDIALPARTGTHHNALDDAVTQAQHARMILEAKYG